MKGKQTKQPKVQGGNTEALKSTHGAFWQDGGYFKTKVTVTAAGRLPSGMLHPVPGSWPFFGAGAPETRGASLVGAIL